MVRFLHTLILVILALVTRIWPEWDGALNIFNAPLTPQEAKILAGVYLTGALVIVSNGYKD